MGGYTRDNMFGLAAITGRCPKRNCQLHRKQGGNGAVYRVMSTGGRIRLHATRSSATCSGSTRSHFHAEPPYSEREIKHVIAQCDFFVGARMHACIAALSQCTPAAMAYSDKFLGVFRSVGVESAVIDVRSLSVGQAVAALSSIYGSREGLRSALKRAMPTVNQLTHTLLRDAVSV